MLYSDPKPLLEDKKFKKFLDRDLYLIILNSLNPETIVNWAKFLVYIEHDDPSAWEVVVDRVNSMLNYFKIDQLLVV